MNFKSTIITKMCSLLVLCLFVASTYAFSIGKVVTDPALDWKIIGGSNAPDVGREDVAGEVLVTLAGWGITETDTTPKDLQHIQLKTTSVQQCKDANAESPYPVEATHICTFSPDGGANSGDSGSPLITDLNGKPKVVGLASWGGPVGYPNVYARASSYFDWFNNICNCL